jgi:hypothetical protein
LRKEGYEQGVVEKVPLGSHGSPIHVNGIAERLKGVERDAHRKQDIKSRRVEREETGEGIGEEVVVFEEKEYGEVKNQRGGQYEALMVYGPAFHKEAGEPGNDDREEEEAEVGRVPACVKEEGSGQEKKAGSAIGPGAIAPGNSVIEEKDEREEDEVAPGIEVHAAPSEKSSARGLTK